MQATDATELDDATELVDRPANMGSGVPYLPSPAEIAAECERIRAGWKDESRRQLAYAEKSPVGDELIADVQY